MQSHATFYRSKLVAANWNMPSASSTTASATRCSSASQKIKKILAREGDSLLTGLDMFKNEIGLLSKRVSALEQTA